MDLQTKILFSWICLQVIFASVFSDVWKAEVATPIEALVSSCVVLPCTFNYPAAQYPESLVKGIWHKTGDTVHRIYDADSYNVVDNFKDRTRLVGRLGQKNCTLEINGVKDHDIGPYCFRAEIKNFDKFSFEEACVRINMIPEPHKPSLDHDESVTEGLPTLFKCYVTHTCPTHPPTIEWSRSDVKPRVTNKHNGHGVWEVESLLSFTATQEDDHKDITCTVTFHGDIKSQVTHKIYVKRKENYSHIIIPVVAVLGTIILFGTGCFFVIKRYKKQIQDLQSGNGGAGSVDLAKVILEMEELGLEVNQILFSKSTLVTCRNLSTSQKEEVTKLLSF
ncbi:myelin-associated glycoprotein-like [Hemibagrus wyckioides]|uniref:myelin-associated glycoprotein-like n=1 Tax=Hemibagrus wyckioides TaxID=337641 RepID=UPI00266B5F11|nr:myelin-associated glycoprotein-like [Hemibagrus wyckioides]